VTAKSWALARWACVAFAVTVGAGCGGASDAEESRPAQVYVATIEGVLAEESPTAGTDELPVVYVVPLGESDIDATVQADVASELREVADVRFADERSEALDEDEPGMPVRDEGVLVAVGDVAEEGQPVDVEVEVYRSEDDWSKRVFTFSLRSSQWTLTSTSVVSVP
jgi:hypothetical protein